MDDESIVTTSKAKTEATNKVKEGYMQLAEKVEQVKNQVAKMERKYDELYQTVKGKDQNRTTTMATDAHQGNINQSESIDDMLSLGKAAAPVAAVTDNATIVPPKEEREVKEAKSTISSRKPSDVDLEKMENNPFV